MLNVCCQTFSKRFMSTSSSTMQNTKFPYLFSEENKQKAVKMIQEAVTKREESKELEKYPFALSPRRLAKRKKAAVLIPLCYDTLGRPSILYELRSMNLSKHKGEISFPGGVMDKEDGGDTVKTALRETEEELGIKPDRIEILIALPGFPTASSQMAVFPVLGFLKDPIDASKLNINPGEVAEAFTIPVEHLLKPDNYFIKEIFGVQTPVYVNFKEFLTKYEPDNGVTLWGLTSILTHIFLTVFLKDDYKLNIPWISGLENVDQSKL